MGYWRTRRRLSCPGVYRINFKPSVIPTDDTLSFLYFYFYTLLHALAARRRAAFHAPLLQTIKRAVTSPTRPVLLGAPTELAIGFVAGVASCAISTPLSVITVRLQTSGDDGDGNGVDPQPSIGPETGATKKQRPGFCEVLRNIHAEESLYGFWAGPYRTYAHPFSPRN